ncbi:MAG: YwqG family protein [Rhodobacteraceae bacterium]|jgi:hypothetical protein|nr:YwqG family protein [Paracoccaceae bacterium]
MTRPVVGLVLGALILAYGVRLVWLRDVFGVPSGQELVGVTILVALLLKQLLGIPLVDPPGARTARMVAHPPAAKEIAMASDDEKLSFEEQFELLGGASERLPAMAAWGLHLHSPFAPPRAATSWFGGVPRAPAGFDWPADAAGDRLHFVAQIDLAALTPVPNLGGPPPGLPRTGALLVFVGSRDEGKWTFAIRFLTPAEVVAGRDCPVPTDLSTLRDVGFWIDDGQTFPRWPVDIVGFADDGEDRPSSLGPVTWGVVAYDLGLVAAEIRSQLRLGARFAEWLASRDPDAPMPQKDVKRAARGVADHALILTEGWRLLASADALRIRALAEDPMREADPEALRAVTAARANLAGRLAQSGKHVLRPDLDRLARVLIEDHAKGQGLLTMPEAYRAFVEPCITGWRGHRLLGKALPPDTHPDDLRGLDCLMSVLSDPILGTRTEHEGGFSIWCDRAALARGDISTCRLVRHDIC